VTVTTERDRLATNKMLREIEEKASDYARLFVLQEQYQQLKADYVKLRNRDKQKRDVIRAMIEVIGKAIDTGVIKAEDFRRDGDDV
jgi:molecular chaperone GrpE (heat shock protein)